MCACVCVALLFCFCQSEPIKFNLENIRIRASKRKWKKSVNTTHTHTNTAAKPSRFKPPEMELNWFSVVDLRLKVNAHTHSHESKEHSNEEINDCECFTAMHELVKLFVYLVILNRLNMICIKLTRNLAYRKRKRAKLSRPNSKNLKCTHEFSLNSKLHPIAPFDIVYGIYIAKFAFKRFEFVGLYVNVLIIYLTWLNLYAWW